MYKKIVEKLSLCKKRNMFAARGVLFEKNAKFDLRTELEGYNKIYSGCRLYKSVIGLGTYIQSNALVYDTHIGRYCSIGPNLSTIVGRHPSKDFVSTHPAFYSLLMQSGFSFVERQKFIERGSVNSQASIVVGNDVFIGASVTLLGGVTVGDGAMIGAGAVVYKDIEPYSVYAGPVLKLLRYRFQQEEIEFLLKFRWWDKPIDWVKQHADVFDDIKRFIEVCRMEGSF